MGDRCYFSVWVRKVDAESEVGKAIIENSFCGPPSGTEGATIKYEEDQMNWGGQDFLDDWNDAGFLCEGFQGGGSDYGPSLFCTTGELDGALDYNTGRHGGFVIDFDDDGNPDQSAVSFVRDFILTRKRVRAEMQKGPLEHLADCADGEE